MEKAPPGDFGDQATLVGGHCLIHHVFRKLLRLLGRFGRGARPMNTQSGILCDPASLVLYRRCQTSSRPHARSRKGEWRRTLSEPFSPFESMYNPHMQGILWRTVTLGPLLLISICSKGGQEVQSPQPEKSKPPVKMEQRGRILGIGGVFFTISGFEEDAADSKDAPALLHFERHGVFLLRSE